MLYLGNVVVFGLKLFQSGKSGCNRGKVVLFGQKWLYSGKSCCIWAKWLYSGKKWLYSGKSGCIRAKWLYSGKSGCIRAKVVLFRQKLLYSGKMVFFRESESIPEKVVVFGQKWFYTGRSGSIQAKVVVVGQSFIVFAFSQVFSLLCLLFAKQSILKSPVDTQISLQKDFYGHSSFYMDESQLLKMFLLKRASRHFVMSVRMKFQKSRYRTLPIVQPHSTLQV